MSDNIRLHPKYGLNPMMSLCIICHKEQGIAIMGYNEGKEAPRAGVCDFIPCDDCKQEYLIKQDGILLLGCDPKSRKPSGEVLIIKKDLADRLKMNYHKQDRLLFADNTVLIQLNNKLSKNHE